MFNFICQTTGRIYFGDAGDHEAGSIRKKYSMVTVCDEIINTERIRDVSDGGSVGIATNDPKTQVDINCFNPSNDAYRGTVKINQYGHILQQNNTVVNNPPRLKLLVTKYLEIMEILILVLMKLITLTVSSSGFDVNGDFQIMEMFLFLMET